MYISLIMLNHLYYFTRSSFFLEKQTKNISFSLRRKDFSSQSLMQKVHEFRHMEISDKGRQ